MSDIGFTFVFDTSVPFEVVIDGITYKTDQKKIMKFVRSFITEEVK